MQKDPHDEMLERFESWTSATKNEKPEDVKEDSVDDEEVFLNKAQCTPSLQAYMNIHAAVHAAKNATKYDGRVYDESVAHPLTVEEFNAMVACLLSGPLMECLIRKKWHPALESIIAHVLSDLQVSSTIIVSTQNVQLSESYLGTIIASDLGTLADLSLIHI